jgi:acylphosphatase
MKVGAHIIIRGMVQGVGFRYFTVRNATALDLTGYVKNLPDGRVEVRVEGEKDRVDELKKILDRGPGFSSVDDIDFRYMDFTAKFKEFSVEY